MTQQFLSKRVNRRTLLKGTAISGVAALVTPYFAGPAEAARCGALRAGITGYNVINTLDPAKAGLIPEFYTIWALFNTLVKFNDRMEVVPDLAESWVAKDDVTWEFTLRKGVKFHDGSEMTAEDVKFTLERLKDEKLGSPHKSKVAAISEISIVSPYVVRIKTDKPFAPLLTYLTNTRTGTQIVPKKVVEKIGDEAFGHNPIGTGAFKLKNWSPNEKVELLAHDAYFVAGQPYVESVNIPLIAEESSGVTALLGGNIDLTSTAPFADVAALEKEPKITVMRSPGLNTRFVEINNRKPPFDDIHFRRAVSMAFDRNAMVKVVVFGEGVAANGIIPGALKWAHEDSPRALTQFNPERAKAEMAKSKYGAGTEVAVLTWGAGWWKRFAEVFAAQVNDTLGTNFRAEVSESATVYARLKAGDFQSSIWGWLGLTDPDSYLFEIFHTTGWRNFHGYSNPEVDKLLEQGRGETDVGKRGAIYKKAESIIVDEVPVVPCFESNVHNLMNKKVKGFVQLPYSAFGGQLSAVKIC